MSPRSLSIIFSLFCGSFLQLSGRSFAADNISVRSLPAPRGDKKNGFREISPQNSGIHFTNSLSVAAILDNPNLLNGAGVALGDFNGDGLCDIYLCATAGTNALYQNQGNFRFVDVTEKAGVGCPLLNSTGALFADIDGDGLLDLLVSTLGTGVHYFHNQGNGTFKELTLEAGLQSNTGSTSMAMADVDGDGDLDLYVCNYGARPIIRSGSRTHLKRENGKWVVTGPYANRLRVTPTGVEELGEADVLYLNDGRGKFTPVPWNSERFIGLDGKPEPEPLDFGLTVQIRDVNSDGFPDIYVSNDFQTPDRLWINNGKGFFKALPWAAMRKQSFSSMGVDFADVDRDGLLDFLVVEMKSRKHSDLIRQTVSTQSAPESPGEFQSRPQIARNTFFHNRGDGTYEEMAIFSGIPATDWSWQAVFLDVDLDGYGDLLVANGMAFDLQDRDTIAATQKKGAPQGEQTRTNLLMYPPLLTSNVALRNRGDLTFEDVSSLWGFASTNISQGMALADLDNDGDLDIVINAQNASPLLLENITTKPRIAVRLQGNSPNTRAIGSTIRLISTVFPAQSHQLLSGGRYLSSDDSLAVFAAPENAKDITVEVRWPNGHVSRVEHQTAGHLLEISESSAILDLIVKAEESSKRMFKDVSAKLAFRHHEVPFDDFARQPLLMRKFSQLGPGVAWFDLDGDGADELILGSGKGGKIQAFKWNGERFSALPAGHNRPLPDDTTGMVAWAFADGERALLVGLANYESGKTNYPSLLSFSPSPAKTAFDVTPIAGLEKYPSSPGPIAVADIDGDGILELFVGGRVVPGRYPQKAVSMIFRQGPTNFIADIGNSRALENVGLVSGAAWADLDNDGFPDLILACEWGPIRIFKNESGHLREATKELGLAGLTGWWNSVAAGDFDEDGRMDFIAGNWGWNTGYSASQDRPLHLYYGDLDGGGSFDLIETAFDQDLGKEVPLRSLSALGQVFPILLQRYPSHKSFSTAPASEILSLLPNKPAVASCTTFSTTLFLNRSNQFVAVPLPRQAQMSPVFGIAVADLDGDGHEDLFLAQNFFDMRPEFERLDAGVGLLLLGNGKGEFQPLNSRESGIQIFGEQRSAAICDFNDDGAPDLVVTQNGAPAIVYQNESGRRGLKVHLQGPTGNPDAIGASLRLNFGDHFGPAKEIHAGSGYWGQDTLSPILSIPEKAIELEVRWPGGKKSVHPLTNSSGKIVIKFSAN